MTDERTGYSIKELAQITSSEIIGDPDHLISGVNSLECADSFDASFLGNKSYLKALKKTKAGVVFLNEPLKELNINQLVHPHPSKAFQKLIELFYEKDLAKSGFESIHPSAVVHPSVMIGKDVTIGPNTTIDQNVVIGERTVIGANVTIGPFVTLGIGCHIHPQVTINHNCKLHNHVIVQSGAIIGSCGFGYITDAQGHHKKLQHIGRVVLQDHVEIGACTCIDRARFKDTCIKKGVKIDNLVQIAHGVHVGEGSIIVSQAGIAGSTSLGKYNVIAGQVGVVGHLDLGDHITIAARGAVTKNLKHPGRYGGAPAIPEEKFYRQQMHFRKLDIYTKKIRDLEARLSSLQNQIEQMSSNSV